MHLMINIASGLSMAVGYSVFNSIICCAPFTIAADTDHNPEDLFYNEFTESDAVSTIWYPLSPGITNNEDPELLKLGKNVIELVSVKDIDKFLDQSGFIEPDPMSVGNWFVNAGNPQVEEMRDSVEKFINIVHELELPDNPESYEVVGVNAYGYFIDKWTMREPMIMAMRVVVDISLNQNALELLDQSYSGIYSIELEYAVRDSKRWMFTMGINMVNAPIALLDDRQHISQLIKSKSTSVMRFPQDAHLRNLMEKALVAPQFSSITNEDDPALNDLAGYAIDFLATGDIDLFRKRTSWYYGDGASTENFLEMCRTIKLPENAGEYVIESVELNGYSSGWNDWPQRIVHSRQIILTFSLKQSALERLGKSHEGQFTMILGLMARGKERWTFNPSSFNSSGKRASMYWDSIPSTILDEEQTREFLLQNSLSRLDLMGDSGHLGPITPNKDFALSEFSAYLIDLISRGNVEKYMEQTSLPLETLVDGYMNKKSRRGESLPPRPIVRQNVAKEVESIYNSADSVSSLARKLKLPDGPESYIVNDIRVVGFSGIPSEWDPFGRCIIANRIEVTIAISEDASTQTDVSYEGEYKLIISHAGRDRNGWIIFGGTYWDKIPENLLSLEMSREFQEIRYIHLSPIERMRERNLFGL